MLTEPVSGVTRWRSTAPADIVWFDVPPDFIAFHRPSGKTHFLNEASKLLLNKLLSEPKDLAEILDVFPSNKARRHVEQMRDLLVHLEGLGLIKRA